jgi:N-acetylmuramoyl-L-alanine amidase
LANSQTKLEWIKSKRQITRATLALGLLFNWVGNSLEAFAQPTRPYHIVLDPGHGGDDEGTVYKNNALKIAEKEITLSLAYATAQQLRNAGYQVTLTRESDQELSLPSRTALANQLKADLFISLHMNSSRGLPSQPNDRFVPQGIETFILNHTSDASSKRLAQLENSLIPKSATPSTEDPDLALILKDLRLDANLSKSKKLACLIQENLAAPLPFEKKFNPRRNRGVKQALFYVLLGADMPSVLVEAGFLSHPKDRSRVLSPKGQIQIGRTITSAVQSFFKGNPNPKLMHSLDKCKIN